MVEPNLYLVWSISGCFKGRKCTHGLFCQFTDNDREYFLDEKKADIIYQRLSQISSEDYERELKLYYRTFGPNDVLTSSVLESTNQEYIEKFPDEIFCLWKISNTSLIPTVINLYNFKDLVLKELEKYESSIDANDYFYGIDRIVINNENMSLNIDLDI